MPSAQRLSGKTPWGGEYWFIQQTTSTMVEARQLEAQGCPSGSVILTDHQSAGRGRSSGRLWESPAGQSLLFTGFWSRQAFAHPVFAPSLVLGLGLCFWLESLELVPRLKWPNDVYLQDQKLAGILVQTQWSGSTIQSLHAGIDLNLLQRQFPQDYRTPPTSLILQGCARQPEAALRELLFFLARAMQMPDPRSACQERLWRLGQTFSIENPTGSGTLRVTGQLQGLAPNGGLILVTETGQQVVHSGE